MRVELDRHRSGKVRGRDTQIAKSHFDLLWLVPRTRCLKPVGTTRGIFKTFEEPEVVHPEAARQKIFCVLKLLEELYVEKDHRHRSPLRIMSFSSACARRQANETRISSH